MKFCFDPESSIQDNISRVVVGQLSKARENLTEPAGGDLHEGIHEARKCFKRLRGLLRMVRPALGKATYQRENTRFRDAAHSLSAVRDAQALVECFDMLEKAFTLRVSFARLRPLQEQLVARRARIARAQLDLEARVGKVVATMDDAIAAIADWPIADAGCDDMARGLRRVYRRAREDWQRACRRHDPARLHEWRKSANYLRYQFQLLQGVGGGWNRSRYLGFRELSELLGDYHDLEVLRGVLDTMEVTGLDPVVECEFRILLREHQDNLYRKALESGPSLLEKDPGQVRRRVRRRLEAGLQKG